MNMHLMFDRLLMCHFSFEVLQYSSFCRAMLCISAAYAIMQCVSLCVSVTFVDCVKTSS